MTSLDRTSIVGWDIGGANTKAARWSHSAVRVRSVPYELRLDPAALVPLLRGLADELGAGRGAAHAVTMTAELSQLFRTKREGVGFVLDALEEGFPGSQLWVYTVNGSFVSPSEARALPLAAGASNWAATARLVAGFVPDCMLIDIGTTSCDIIPIIEGRLAATGRTDPERLMTRELVYTGAVRTPVEAIARVVPLWGGDAAVSAEGFALVGDVHLWLGHLSPDDYSVRPPDGRPPTREYAAERLARVVCADREMLDPGDIDALARALAEAQVSQVAQAITVVRSRHRAIDRAVVAGVGDFIATEAAVRAGLQVTPLADRLGDAARTAPAAAVAWLLAGQLRAASK